jgi:hypothetical protein
MVVSSAVLETKMTVLARISRNLLDRTTRRIETVGRYKRRWDNNIKRDFREIGSGVMNLIDLAQNRDQ